MALNANHSVIIESACTIVQCTLDCTCFCLLKLPNWLNNNYQWANWEMPRKTCIESTVSVIQSKIKICLYTFRLFADQYAFHRFESFNDAIIWQLFESDSELELVHICHWCGKLAIATPFGVKSIGFYQIEWNDRCVCNNTCLYTVAYLYAIHVCSRTVKFKARKKILLSQKDKP